MESPSLESQIHLLKEKIRNHEGKPLTIAVVGQHGCGKSSFINTALAVLTGEYHERAIVGSFGKRGGHVTRRVTRYTKKRYLGKSNEDEMRHGYPTFVDMMGFQNDENVNEFLENVFEGHVREGTEFNRPQEQRKPLVSMQQLALLLGNEIVPRVDRIIFVASAVSKEFPEELINAVKLQASGRTREIPLFGVLTHGDEITEEDEQFQKMENDFKECLGLSPMRYLRCTNYCSNFPQDDERNPDIEIPVMRFLRQVIDTERDVLEKERSITDHLYRRMNMKLKTITVYFLQVILVMLYLFFIMITPSEIRSFCSSMKKTGQEQYLPSLVYLCKLNSDGKIMEKPSLLYLFLFLAFVYYGVTPLFKLCLKHNANLKAVFDQRVLTCIGMERRGK
ncbi:uncharacterized protein [Magallana gigas]|uniref:uncharacterized protein n=1 Tax=Magallana gigas TaxID=29159 RepID=UPI003342CDE0